MVNIQHKTPDILTKILSARGMAPKEIDAFISPSYEQDLHNPGLITDMQLAVDRIVEAGKRREQVVIYGDYDIDGITATAVMLEGLSGLGMALSSYIPDRFEEGYGINQAALEYLQTQGAQLVISVDCGITSVEEAKWAKAHGLDLIITDHHAVPEEIPDAIAVINPKRVGDEYPFKELAGVGVAFKVVQAIQQRTGLPALGQEKWLLDLVALGTICDVVPLIGENRVLATYGLKVLRRSRRLGLDALAKMGKVELAKIGSYEVGFVLGPRMNAAGRLQHAARSLELLTTSDPVRATDIAGELEALNMQRRADQAKIFTEADNMAADYVNDSVLVLAHTDWSHGVVGIVASKLAEKWHRPVLLAQILGETIKGSARSVAGFDMVAALRSQSQLMNKYGGHFFAAGYSLPVSNLEKLRTGLSQYRLDLMSSQPEIEVEDKIDLEMSELKAINSEIMSELALLEPHGNANPRPSVRVTGMLVEQIKRVGNARQHLSLKLLDGAGRRIGAIGFGLSEKHAELQEGRVVAVVGTFNNNEFQGHTSIQMVVSKIIYE